MLLFTWTQDAWDALGADQQDEVWAELKSGFDSGVDGQIRWVEELVFASSVLKTGRGDQSHRCMYWLRLHGLLRELRPGSHAQFDSSNDVQRRMFAVVDELSKRYDAIAASFDRNELIYIEYQRNIEAHPFVHGHFMKAKEKQGRLVLKREREIALLGETVSLHDIRAAVHLVEDGNSALEVARRFARERDDLVADYFSWLNSKFDIFD